MLGNAMIVDAQAHIWGASTPLRPWPAGGAATCHRESPLGAEDLLQAMDGAGVDRCVLVPPSWEGDRNDLVLEAAARYPDRFAVMGRFPVEDRAAAERLATWRSQPGMLGIRLTLHRSPWRELFAQGALDWFWRAAERVDLPVMVYAPGMLAQIDLVATRHPGLRIILDHLALEVGLEDDEAFASLDELLTLARHPNIGAKASALPCHSSQPYPFPGLHRHLFRVFDAFGPERVFWGSDYSRLPCSYRDAIALFSEALEFLSEQDREWIMGRALLKWLGWSE